jgi:zinc finger protein 830
MLKNERAARKIKHKHASYSTTGTLLCIVCHLQLKSEALWDGHLRSPGHILRLQKLEDSQQENEQTLQPTAPEPITNVQGNKKKRKASDDEEDAGDTNRKRTKGPLGILEGLYDVNATPELQPLAVQHLANEIQIPSRPATPLKPTAAEHIPKQVKVDEDEWAAFEADIAAAEVPAYDVGVITAAPVSAAELAKMAKEEDNKMRRERQEAEMEGDKEDAARKLEEEFEEMEGLEERVKRLREKREALRIKQEPVLEEKVVPVHKAEMEQDEEDDEDFDDDWDGFRMKG